MAWSDKFRKKKAPEKVSPLLEKEFNKDKRRLKFTLDGLKNLKAKLGSLSDLKKKFSKPKAKNGRLGLSFHDHELAVAFVQYEDGEPALQLCECHAASTFSEAEKILTGLVAEHGLDNVNCNFVLSAEDYKLLLIEAPSVEDAEIADAARWKIKDMVDKPLEELVVSVFRVPDDAYRVNRDMLYVVAADRKRIEHVVELAFEAGLKLESIDIAELAMMNVLDLQKIDDANGVAMIDLRYSGSLLNLCKNSELYLTRHLNTQVAENISDSHDWETVKERLVLEIQRSLDYYESQMGQGHVNRIFLAPRKQDSDALTKQLNEVMGVEVEVLDLQLLPSEKILSIDTQNSCLMAIGGALRVEEAA